MPEKHVVLTKVEKADYQGKEYRKITTQDGQQFNVKEGKNGALRKKWLLLEQCIGKTITLNMGDYQGKEYVQDILLPLPENAPVNNAPATPQVYPNTQFRSFAMSYSKDLVVAGELDIRDIARCADYILGWLEGKVTTHGLDDVGWMLPKGEVTPKVEKKTKE
jgi:hypothetical protein